MSTSNEPPENVLELRVHGVNNTPPHEMLDVPKEDIARSFGDELGSFWHQKPEAVARGRENPPQGGMARGVVDPAQSPRGRVPDGMYREAYSWGGMVRTTPPESGPGGAIIAAFARVAWTLLLPFSIANAAMYSWQLPPTDAKQRVHYGSALVRVACLGITVVFVLALASVAIDLLALQCYRTGVVVCPPLSGTFDGLRLWQDEQRVALFSLVPIAGVLIVWLVSSLSTLRYNIAGGVRPTGTNPTSHAWLADPKFWHTRKETQRLALLHLAAAIAVVALVLSFAFDRAPGLVAEMLGVASLGVIAVIVVLVVLTDSTPLEVIEPEPKPSSIWLRAPIVILGLAAVLYAGIAVSLAFVDPLVLRPRAMGAASDVVFASVVGVILVLIVLAAALHATRRNERAWWGLGAAVFLTLGLAVALILGSLLNVLVGDWMNGTADASQLDDDDPFIACRADPCQPEAITMGGFYAPFLGVTLAAVIATFLFLAILAARPRKVNERDPSPDPSTLPNDDLKSLREKMNVSIKRKQATAARLHLAEPVVGFLAATFFIAIIVTLLLPMLPLLVQIPNTTKVTATWVDVSLVAWVLIGTAILAGLVFGGSRATRPVALIWDLACFLPRSGHPFGAPCYTERAVPEVARRIEWWLDLPPSVPGQARRVVLSAHSMGAVVAVSALFAMCSDQKWESRRDRVALLTFGIQLRPYFGRFFPEILGPDVLDSVPCGRPRPFARDPWRKGDLRRKPPVGTAGVQEPAPDGDAPVRAVPGDNGVGVPGRAWISLWRLTDYLGFPASSFGTDENTRDRYAEELDLSGYVAAVDTHGWYYRSPTYHRALTELAALPPVQRGSPGYIPGASGSRPGGSERSAP